MRRGRRVRSRVTYYRGLNTSYGTTPPMYFSGAKKRARKAGMGFNLGTVTKVKNYLPALLMAGGINAPSWMLALAGLFLKSDALYGYGIGLLAKEKLPKMVNKTTGVNLLPVKNEQQQVNPILSMLNRANQFHGYNVNDFAGMGPSAVDQFSGSANEFKV